MKIASEKPFLLDFDFTQLEAFMESAGEPKFRAQQIWEGIFHSQVLEVDSITAIPINLRNKINANLKYLSLTPISEYHSNDQNTEKILFETWDKNKIESVLMKYNKRNTLCISTQSGCAMGCVFCATGQMGFYKNLSSSEIVEQVIFFSRRLNEAGEKVTNIVFMGMGEPFHNYESTMKAIDILGHPKGMNIGARRMTISTVGIVPQIIHFANENSQVNLAVSLHAIDNMVRNNMMPINKKFPVENLLRACAYYVEKTNRRISFEWALIEGKNDSTEIARQLAKKLRPLLCHVNLIQLNPTEKFSGTGSSNTSAQEFKVILENAGIPCTIRLRRGIDIHAGCGQLASSAV